MTEFESLNSTVIRMLLREDGLSSDGVPANSVGGGGVQGIGFGPKGEPGGMTHRKRKRIAKAQSPALFKAMASEGYVELDLKDHLSDAGQRRFNEGKSEGAIEVEPVLPINPKEIDSDNPRLRKKKSKPQSKRSLKGADGSELLLNPILPNRFEDKAYRPIDNVMMSEAHKRRQKRPTQRCDFLVKMGLGDIEHLTWYRNAIQDPFICINSAQYRPVVAEVLDQLLDLIFADPVLYNRLRMQLLQNREREQSEEVDDDVHERGRFARWKAAQQS